MRKTVKRTLNASSSMRRMRHGVAQVIRPWHGSLVKCAHAQARRDVLVKKLDHILFPLASLPLPRGRERERRVCGVRREGGGGKIGDSWKNLRTLSVSTAILQNRSRRLLDR